MNSIQGVFDYVSFLQPLKNIHHPTINSNIGRAHKFNSLKITRFDGLLFLQMTQQYHLL